MSAGRRGEPTVNERPEGEKPVGSLPRQDSWRRVAGIGFDLAGAVGGFALIGFWIGRHYDSERAGLLIGSGLGLAGGLYNLIRQGLRASREMDESSKRQD